ncbi:MAG TPA: clostripain-related cysteine peptidase [Pyrinomonadaceae bacterium]|nr:clostripain-related cysteine peptidase [Pyrinomonadaceae bacterium]
MSRREECAWTVMIFMVADNNLSEKCELDLREIKRAGSSEDVKVIVQTDLSPAGGPTTRYFIRPGGPDSLPQEDIDDRWRETPPEVLRDFVHWCISHHPARHYMLLLWGHGRALDSFQVSPAEPVPRRVSPHRFSRGGRRRRRREPGGERGKPFFIICPDDQAGHAITNKELQVMLKSVARRIDGGKIHVLGMVACLMGMFEMCYELRESVRYMIGSESLIPDTSLPFDKIIPLLIENPGMEPGEVCRTIVREFKRFYVTNDGLPVQLSAFDLSKADALREELDRLAGLLTGRIRGGDAGLLNALLGSHFQTQRYDEDQFFDLYDFCYMLRLNCGDPDVREMCQSIMRLVGDGARPGFVVATEFNGDALQFSYGLAIYFPWVNVNEARYGSLDFAKPLPAVGGVARPTWLDFLNTYVDGISKTGRAERDTGEG